MLYYIHNHTSYDSIYNHLYKNPNHLIHYTYTDINDDSIFAFNYIDLFNLHLHSRDSCWIENLVSFTLDMKLNTFFTFIFFILFGTQIEHMDHH